MANGPTLVVEVYPGSLAWTGGMSVLRPYHIIQVDVGHDLTKDQKVKLFPGECAAVVPYALVVVGIKVLAALSFAATANFSSGVFLGDCLLDGV